MSALGVAVADSINGPYVNKQIILRSGMPGLSDDGVTNYDAQVHPNVVDPNTFFDATGTPVDDLRLVLRAASSFSPWMRPPACRNRARVTASI